MGGKAPQNVAALPEEIPGGFRVLTNPRPEGYLTSAQFFSLEPWEREAMRQIGEGWKEEEGERKGKTPVAVTKVEKGMPPPNSRPNNKCPVADTEQQNGDLMECENDLDEPLTSEARGKVLDLFSGTGSVKNCLQKMGFQVISLDIDPKCKPDILCDLLTWDFHKAARPGDFELICASVPCSQYSRANTTGSKDHEWADALAHRVLKIIRYFRPQSWWIENPRFGDLQHKTFMEGIPFVDIDYCQFCDWGYKKPTRFWGSHDITSLPSVLCDPDTCPNMFSNGVKLPNHVERLGGNSMKFSSKAKGRIPPRVLQYLVAGMTSSVLRRKAEMEIAPRLLQSEQQFQVHQVTHHKNSTQMVLEVAALHESGDDYLIKILIDTGAEENLVRKGFFPDEYFYSPARPLSFVTANGQPLSGGKKVIDLTLAFREVVGG